MTNVFVHEAKEVSNRVGQLEDLRTRGVLEGDASLDISCAFHESVYFESFQEYAHILLKKKDQWPTNSSFRMQYFNNVSNGMVNGLALMDARSKERLSYGNLF